MTSFAVVGGSAWVWGSSPWSRRKSGRRFSRKAVAPSTMSGLPIACTSMPMPWAKLSRAEFHQMFELTLVISR